MPGWKGSCGGRENSDQTIFHPIPLGPKCDLARLARLGQGIKVGQERSGSL